MSRYKLNIDIEAVAKLFQIIRDALDKMEKLFQEALIKDPEHE
jgi:hypothetical protein